DFSEFKRMCTALYREDAVDEEINLRKISKTVRELHQNPCKGLIIIFEENAVIAGYSILIFYWSNEFGGNVLHIDELYVKPEFRRRGIATEFFQYISRTFKDQIVAFQLEVTPSNKTARSHYQRLGFVKTRNVHLRRKNLI
ncbi:MAG TPA: GNAT family N-acetyltransferase, partial [Terriglobales bacterium]|nr:GNAT family N-acetyltransferase [Terriglobales bacterium]